jgi:hypothetical protein
MQTALTPPMTRKPRDPVTWSIARPGAEYEIEPVTQQPPEDLDPHLARITDDRFSVRIITLDAEADALRERLTRGHLLIGLFAAAMLGIVCFATVIGAASRIPAIEQQLADAARV